MKYITVPMDNRDAWFEADREPVALISAIIRIPEGHEETREADNDDGGIYMYVVQSKMGDGAIFTTNSDAIHFNHKKPVKSVS